MRRFLLILSSLILSVALFACSNKEEVSKPENNKVSADVEYNYLDDPKSLVNSYDEALETTWKNTSFDMQNNLQKPFFIRGTAELSNYYNYGYTNTKKLFCVELTPEDGSFSDRWYVYMDREKFREVYDGLINNDNKTIEVIAFVPEKVYEKDQGNMAVALTARY